MKIIWIKIKSVGATAAARQPLIPTSSLRTAEMPDQLQCASRSFHLCFLPSRFSHSLINVIKSSNCVSCRFWCLVCKGSFKNSMYRSYSWDEGGILVWGGGEGFKKKKKDRQTVSEPGCFCTCVLLGMWHCMCRRNRLISARGVTGMAKRSCCDPRRTGGREEAWEFRSNLKATSPSAVGKKHGASAEQIHPP